MCHSDTMIEKDIWLLYAAMSPRASELYSPYCYVLVPALYDLLADCSLLIPGSYQVPPKAVPQDMPASTGGGVVLASPKNPAIISPSGI